MSNCELCGELIPEDDLVGNGGEDGLDGEWHEDHEWLEAAGFKVTQGTDSADRVWLRTIAGEVRVAVYPSGSTALLWRCRHHDDHRELQLLLEDNATKGAIMKLCEVLGNPISFTNEPTDYGYDYDPRI